MVTVVRLTPALPQGEVPLGLHLYKRQFMVTMRTEKRLGNYIHDALNLAWKGAGSFAAILGNGCVSNVGQAAA